ncbi:MAG: hypothetical protein EZS28_049684, partial [Streblomastix strix]
KKLLPPNTKYMPIHVEQQEFSAMYLFKDITNTNESAPNEASNEATSDSFIDEVIIKHEKQLAYNTFYIVDDGTCRVCVFNLYFESKGLNRRTQEVGRIPDSILPADGKKPQESIPTDSADVYKYCASGMYYL